MEKLKVNSEVYSALNRGFRLFGKEIFLASYISKVKNSQRWETSNFDILNQLDEKEMIKVFSVGYELEVKKEMDAMVELFQEAQDEIKIGLHKEFNRGYRLGIKQILDTLELEIEGINK